MTSRSSKGKAPTNMQKPTSIITVGLDIGYGNTKGIADTGTVVFPSVAGYARDIKFSADEISGKYPGDQLTDNQGDWFVGELALKQIPEAQLLMLKGRTANEDELGMAFRLRMMYAALAKLFPYQHGDAVHIRIATGLPVDHMRDAATMKEALIGQHKISTNNANFIANITDVMVMPQPYGTLYSQQLLPNGALDPHYTAIRSAVVDVGRFTVDCALDDNGEYIDAESGSLEAGVHTVQERLAAVLEADFRQKPTYAEVEHVLRTGYHQAFGEPVDYRTEVDKALKPLRDGTLGIMNRLWGSGMGIDAVWVTGGGGDLVRAAVMKAYRQARLVKDAQISNAIGYRSYALSVAE